MATKQKASPKPKPTSRKRAKGGASQATSDVLVAFCLDMSGSMTSCWMGAIEGFNQYLKDLQDDTEGETFFSLTAFDTVFEPWHTVEPVADIPYLDDKRYVPRGGTALYDAIANTVVAAEERLKAMG